MAKSLLLSPAYGWFIGLLVVMIIVTALFAFILYIALRPVKRDGMGGDANYAKQLLGRREAELTAELLKTQNDHAKKEELIAKLREVASAEKLINELVLETEGPQEVKKADKPKHSGQKPLPAQAKTAAQAKPAQAKPAAQTQPAQAKPAEPTQPAQAKPAAPAQPAQAKPAAPAKAEPEKSPEENNK